MSRRSLYAGVAIVGVLVLSSVQASLRPDKIHVADLKKTQKYLKDGVVVGGDRLIDDVVVRAIRRGAQGTAFDRIVIDLHGNREGETVAIPRPPFFQVAMSQEEERMVITIWGHPKIQFPLEATKQALTKSPYITGVNLLPKIKDEFWTFELSLKRGTQVEVFELKEPVRLIVDLKK